LYKEVACLGYTQQLLLLSCNSKICFYANQKKNVWIFVNCNCLQTEEIRNIFYEICFPARFSPSWAKVALAAWN